MLCHFLSKTVTCLDILGDCWSLKRELTNTETSRFHQRILKPGDWAEQLTFDQASYKQEMFLHTFQHPEMDINRPPAHVLVPGVIGPAVLL